MRVLATLLLVLVFLPSIVSAAVLLSDQGTDVKNIATGNVLTSGNLTIKIYDSSVGGTLVYNNSFLNAIINGSWNVMINPDLEFGKHYWKDIRPPATCWVDS